MMVQYSNVTMERFFGSGTATARATVPGNRPLPKTGRRRSESFANGFRPETTSFSRSSGRGNNFNFQPGWIFPGELFRATPASRENTRGQFARYLAFEKILRRSSL